LFRRFCVLRRRTVQSHLKEGEGSMGKGNNSQKNDKKNKKAKQGSKKPAGKPSDKK
jgi:hypothetical protein